MDVRKAVVAIALVALVAAGTVAAYVALNQPGGPTTSSANTTCAPLGGTGVLRSQLQSVTFGAVKEYQLPAQARWPNGIAVAPDGSIWFGEDSVPGLGHLSVNGTLVEYPWPTAGWTTKGTCGYKTGIWGVALWNGGVWASDQDENALVGVNPLDGSTTVVNLTGKSGLPYTLETSPDGSLWFTTLQHSGMLGRLAPNGTVYTYTVEGLDGEYPSQLQFVNSSTAYFVALNPQKPYGHLYAFDPMVAGSTITPVQVGGSFQIRQPTSLSITGDSAWVAQHQSSSVALYDAASSTWTVFPTSTEDFTSTTLPYFVESTQTGVWFNEHYANRMAFLNASAWKLTEYSEANPPIDNGSLIQNDLTIAQSGDGVWFTSMTGNYVGFVDGAYRNPFSLSLNGSNSAALLSGQTANLTFRVRGSWSTPLLVSVADSETYDAVPSLISIVPSVEAIPAGTGQSPSAEFRVAVTPESSLAPGRYTVAVSVSDGLVTQTVYFFLAKT